MAQFFPEPRLIFTRRGGSNSPEQWLKTLHIIQNGRSVLLNRLGRILADFDKKPLLDLLKHDNERIKCLLVKNLAKIGDNSLVNGFKNIVEKDNSSSVRREAISAIGRLRNSSNKQIFLII